MEAKDSDESASKKPDANEAKPDNVPGKKPRWDLSAKIAQTEKICMKAERYTMGLERQSIQIKQQLKHLSVIEGAFNKYEAGYKKIYGKMIEMCKNDQEIFRQSLDKFREMRLNIEELAICYEKERDKTIEEAKANGPPPPPSSPLRLGPQDLTNLGLDDLNKLIRDELVPRVLPKKNKKNKKAVKAIQKQLLIERLNRLPPLESYTVKPQPADSPLLPPIRPWMNPLEKRRQMRKRVVALAKSRPKHKPRVIERTTPRTEMKKKKLDMLKPSRQHRRERNRALIMGDRFMFRYKAEEAYAAYCRIRVTMTRYPFVFTCFLRWGFGVVDRGNWRHPLDNLIDNIKNFEFDHEWPWGPSTNCGCRICLRYEAGLDWGGVIDPDSGTATVLSDPRFRELLKKPLHE